MVSVKCEPVDREERKREDDSPRPMVLAADLLELQPALVTIERVDRCEGGARREPCLTRIERGGQCKETGKGLQVGW